MRLALVIKKNLGFVFCFRVFFFVCLFRSGFFVFFFVVVAGLIFMRRKKPNQNQTKHLKTLNSSMILR